MALSKHHERNFQTLLDAAHAGHLALMDCTCATTGEKRAVLCAVSRTPEGDFLMVPFGHLSNGNPFEEYIPPE